MVLRQINGIGQIIISHPNDQSCQNNYPVISCEKKSKASPSRLASCPRGQHILFHLSFQSVRNNIAHVALLQQLAFNPEIR